jgi:signal transduction histidine kinase
LVIVTGAPVLINNLEEQQTFLENRGTRPLLIPGARPSASWMGVPLRSRDGVVMGLVSVQSEYTNAFSERDVQLLTTIGTQISLAMENASLFTRLTDAALQLKERAKRTETLYQIATLLSATLDQDHILSLAAEQINKLLEADHCGIVLIDQDKNVARLVAEYPETMLSRQDFTISDLSTFNELWDKDILAYVDPRNDPRLDFQRDSIVEMGIRSILIARLFAKGRLIGSIGIDMVNREHVFTPEQIEVVRTLANQLALAVDNAELYKQALAANEMKSQFLATMSHELRTPLNAIMGYTEMILAGVYGPVSDKQRDRLDRVYINAQHLLLLINDVLDLAKIESGRLALHLETINILPLVQTVITNIAPQAEAKKLTLTSRLPENPPPVQADTVRLRQILINLMSNAVKFTREGSVTLNVDLWDVAMHKRPPTLPEDIDLHMGQWLVFSVSDTGIGIAPENFKLIFDAFRQVDGSAVREFQGTGLGLAITRELVEMHGGKLWVVSSINKGSTFTFVLPLMESALGNDGFSG